MSAEPLDFFTSGEECELFGVYETACCRYEMVITDGAIFPDCPAHHKKAQWNLVTAIDCSRPIDLAA